MGIYRGIAPKIAATAAEKCWTKRSGFAII